MKIKIAMYKGMDTWHHKLIGWYTGGIYTHAEIVMPDNFTWIGISPFLTSKVGSRIKTDFDLENWDFVSLEIDESQHEVIQNFYEDTAGCKYDWIGMIMSQFLPFHIKRKNKWYCSEWIAYALRIAGVIDWRIIKIYDQADLSPRKLHEIISNQKEEQQECLPEN